VCVCVMSSNNFSFIVYFTSAAVAVDSSHMTASSSASWSGFSLSSNFVNGVYGLLLATVTGR